MDKQITFIPFRNNIQLGIEMNLASHFVEGGDVSYYPNGTSYPTHYYVYVTVGRDKVYLGFACSGCHGENGKVRAELDPIDDDIEMKLCDDLNAAVDWLEEQYEERRCPRCWSMECNHDCDDYCGCGLCSTCNGYDLPTGPGTNRYGG
jgi:hypothetical protein